MITRTFMCALASVGLVISETERLRAQGVTSSALQGTVVDMAGVPLVGAVVEATHVPSATKYQTVTRCGGQYSLNYVRVGGPYLVMASRGGESMRVTGVVADLGQVTEVDFRLATSPSVISAEPFATAPGEPARVIVEASQIEDELFAPTRDGPATTIFRQQIDALPSISRSLQDFTRLTPQVVGGSVASTNNRFNNITVDGATVNDVFGLSPSGLLTDRAEPISLDAVETFRVNIAPYDLKYSGFTGGSIDAVTRSGSNTFKGSVYAFYRGSNLIGKFSESAGSPLSPAVEGFQEYTYGARLAGPLIKDTLFFFVLAESKRRTEPQFGAIGASTSFPATPADFERVINDSIRLYHYNPGTSGAIGDRVNDYKITAKLDWNISRDQKFTFSYKHINADYTDGITRNNTSFALTGVQYDRPYRSNSFVGQLFSTWSPVFTTEARVAFNMLRTERTVGTPFPYINGVQVSSGNRINFGVERNSQENSLDQNIVESVFNATYYRGDHTIGAGVGVDHYGFRNLFIPDAFGTYDFGSSVSIRATPGNPAVPFRTGFENFELGRPTRYRYSYSLVPGVTYPATAFDYYNAGGFIQDRWRVTPQLTLNYGLRVDAPIFNSQPLYNPQFFADYGMKTSQLPASKPLVSPRLGYNWNVFGTDFTPTEILRDATESKDSETTRGSRPWWQRGTVVRGGLGVFTGVTPRVFLANQFSNTGVDLGHIDQTFGTSTRPTLPLFNHDPFNQPQPGQSGLSPIQTTAIALTSPGFVFPQNLRGNFAIDQRLPFGFVLTLEGLYTKALEAVQFQNLNLSSQTGTLPDGRPVFGGLGPVGTDRRRNYTSVILMSNTSLGQSYSGSVILELPRTKKGVYFKAAYVYSRAFSVNDTTSSTALTNYENTPISGNPNNPGQGRSFFETRHRFIAALDYQFAIKRKWETTVGAFYEGRSGTPYCFVFTNDANQDGVFGNDLVYVPKGPGDVLFGTISSSSGNLIPSAPGTEAAFLKFVQRNPYLRLHRGEILPRFGGTNPWINRFDFRLTQNIPVPGKGHLEFYYDILNILNLISAKSGTIQTWGGTTFGTPGLASYQGTVTVNGVRKSVYNYHPGVGELSVPNGAANVDSRWQMQFGLRYSF